MAIELVTAPNSLPLTTADYQAQNALIDNAFLNYGSLIPFYSGNIKKGAVFNIGGLIYRATSDTAITGTTSNYVKITASGTTATAAYVSSLSGVSWNDTYNGYYSGSDLVVFDESLAVYNGVVTTPRTRWGAVTAINANLFDNLDSARFIYGSDAYGTTSLSGVNLDTVAKTGFYYCFGCTNIPVATNGYLIHHNISGSSTYAKQQFTSYGTTGATYSRVNINGTWSAWALDYNANNVAGTWPERFSVTPNNYYMGRTMTNTHAGGAVPVLLLCKAPYEGTVTSFKELIGTITLKRGSTTESGLTTIINIESSVGYDKNRIKFSISGYYENWTVGICTYNSERWMCLYYSATALPVTPIFTGYATDLPILVDSGDISSYVADTYITYQDMYGEKGYKYWHSGNDGSGSGLDADYLRGSLSVIPTTRTVLTGSGTWTCPAGVTRVKVKLVGGGGGGGGGLTSSSVETGGGGGSSGEEKEVLVAVTPGTGYSYSVGAGGAGGAVGANGSDGGSTSFHSSSAYNGFGGKAATTSVTTSGIGGSGLGTYPGVDGGTGYPILSSSARGGNGGRGGRGGYSSNTGEQNGVNATLAGGGGGGGHSHPTNSAYTGTGGNGAAGTIIIEY